MVQHPGQLSALEVSASAIVPTLSPAGSLGFDDFTNLTPLVKEELRFAIQNKRQFHKMSSTLDTVTVSERPVETSMMKTEVGLFKQNFGVNINSLTKFCHKASNCINYRKPSVP